MKLLLLTIIALYLVSGQLERGDKGHNREEEWDIGNKTMDDDYLDEDIQVQC